MSFLSCNYAELSFRFLDFQYLHAAGLYESQEEAVRREEVLGRLDQVELSCVVFALRALYLREFGLHCC